MPTLSGITYEDLPGSGVVTYAKDDITARRLIMVDWGDATDFVRALLGFTVSVGGVPIRTLGQQYPDYEYLYATTATVEGIGELAPGEPATYDRAKITVGYEPSRFQTSPEDDDPDADPDVEDPRRYLNETYDFGGSFISAPRGNFAYTDEILTPVEQPVGIRDPSIVLQLESNIEPELPMADIRARLGTVNNAPWYGAATECVLFDGGSARRVLGVDGTQGWTITYRFIAKYHSWNWFFRGEGGAGANHGDGWWRIESFAGGRPPYDSTDFAVLIDA